MDTVDAVGATGAVETGAGTVVDASAEMSCATVVAAASRWARPFTLLVSKVFGPRIIKQCLAGIAINGFPFQQNTCHKIHLVFMD